MAPKTLTNVVVIKSVSTTRYAYYMNETVADSGYAHCEEESVFSPMAKIQVERASKSSKLVHLRFCHSNKYWARRGSGVNDYWIIASSDQPEEDTSKQSCTLFEPIVDGAGRLFLKHVQSGGRVRVTRQSGNMSSRIYVDPVDQGDSQAEYAFSFVDWNTLVKLPKFVTFKKEWYLRARLLDGLNYLQFGSQDWNEIYTAYEVQSCPDGHVRIKSVYYGLFWVRLNEWIRAESSDNSSGNKDTLFWPVKHPDNTIALRASNNRFCKRLSADWKSDVLSSCVDTITDEAKFEVKELVLERFIYDVRYRMEYARIFDERPFVVGTGVGVNNTDKDSKLTIKIAYEDTTSYSFSNSVSVRTGVETTIKFGLPSIADGEIKVSLEVEKTFEWQKTTEEKKTAEASYELIVPANSQARVNYVATRGTCNLPFTYTQRDKLSKDGTFDETEYIDGIFNGVNYYSFRFEQPQIEYFIKPKH